MRGLGKHATCRRGSATAPASPAHVGEADASVPRSAFHHGAPRADLPGPLGGEDEGERGPVLDGAARIHKLGLAQDFAPGLFAQGLDA